MGAYQALKELVDFKSKSMQEITYDNYYFKCGERLLNQQEYDMSSEEKSVLKGIYLLYEIKLNKVVEIRNIFKEARSTEFQRDFYAKLFIYDKIRQIEKENGINEVGVASLIYHDYVVELNTSTDIDGERLPKSAMDIFQDFAKEELKEDKEFLRMVHNFYDSKIEMTFSCSEEELSSISLCPIEKTEGNFVGEKADSSTSEKKGIVIDFCKRKRRKKKN